MAYNIYFQDEGEKFIFKNALRLMKDESNWRAGSSKSFTKRTQSSIFGAYSWSSNPLTPISSKYKPSSPTLLCRSIGHTTTKMKKKYKIVKISTSNIKFNALKDGFKRNELMLEFRRVYACVEGEKVEIKGKIVNTNMKNGENKIKRLNTYLFK